MLFFQGRKGRFVVCSLCRASCWQACRRNTLLRFFTRLVDNGLIIEVLQSTLCNKMSTETGDDIHAYATDSPDTMTYLPFVLFSICSTQ